MATAVAKNGGWEVQGAANGGNGPAARACRATAQAETGVQARAVMRRAKTEAQAETLTAALTVAVKAAAEAGKLKATVAAEAGRGNEKVYKAKTSPLLL